MASDLPEEFDVIVLGTGLPETILAAAFSRIGLSVLHLDRNNYYSGSWASFSLRSIPEWITEQQKAECYVSGVDQDKLTSLLKEGEKALQLPESFPVVTEAHAEYHVGERPAETPSEASHTQQSSASSPPLIPSVPLTDDPAKQTEAKPAGEGEPAEEDSAPELCAGGDVIPGQFDSAPEDGEEGSGSASGSAQGGATVPGEGKKEEEGQKEKEAGVKEKKLQEWFKEDVAKLWRKFSFDLAPKLLYCSGAMVELLIMSDVAKYCEFRTVSRVLTLRDHKLEKVPCSRADVFSSKALSLLEKRLLMKFLTFAAEYDTQPQEYQDFVGKPFVQFLASKKLSPKIQHFILHSIAMATQATSTEQGLEGIQKFLRSLGRYGNTAFLFPLYGSGELPQGFCRLSAVFSGIYVLTLSVSHLLMGDDNKCTGVITTAGQRISCKYLIAGPSYLPKDFYSVPEDKHISRGIFVTDSSIVHEEGEDLSLLQFPHEGQLSSPTTTVLELPPSAMASPRPLYVVHMTRRSVADVQSDLQPVMSKLFHDEHDASQEEGASEDGAQKARILWSLRFKQRDLSSVTCSQQTPANVFVVRGPGTELDTDHCVAETRQIFQSICPDEEFLPKPPHPDDIIYVDTEEVPTAPTDKGESATEGADEDTDQSAVNTADIAQSAVSTDNAVQSEHSATAPSEGTVQSTDSSEVGDEKEDGQKTDEEKKKKEEEGGDIDAGRKESLNTGDEDSCHDGQKEGKRNEGAES